MVKPKETLAARAAWLPLALCGALSVGLGGCFAEIGYEEDPNLDEAVALASSGFVRVTPYRQVDTRKSSVLGAGTERCWVLGDQIPSNAAAVALNLTAVAPKANGHLTAFPYKPNATRPGVSSLNYTAGSVVANGVIIGVGEGKKICVYTLAESHVVIDVMGYFPTTTAFTPVTPFRRVDTRDGSILNAGTKRCWAVAGRNGIPSTAAAVAINLTAVAPDADGHLTAFPYDVNNGSVPSTSSLNYRTGQVVANGAIVTVGDDGSICVYTLARTNIVIDVTGYFGQDASYTAIAPTRAYDTRSGSVPMSGSTRCIQVAGKFGIPKSASAVAVNLTAVAPIGPGYLRARPAGQTGIGISSLNYGAGEVRANNAVVQPGAYGRVCIYTTTNSDYVLDVVGYWPGEQNPDPITHPHTFSVSNKRQFLDALEKASAGDTIAIAPSAQIDLTGNKEIPIPGGVTIHGGRSKSTAGALIHTRDRTQPPGNATWNLLRTAGAGVVVKNLRLQGPDGSPGGTGDFMACGLSIRHDNALVERSEIFHWPACGVSTNNTANARVEKNYIHDNIRSGRGYGVVVGRTKSPTLIKYNSFRKNRHSVAGNGYGSYEVAYNRFMDSDTLGMHSLIDMHGVNERLLDNSTHQAGVDIHIHHNDIEYRSTGVAVVGIRGVPKYPAIIEDNCVARTDSTWVQQWDMTAYASPQSGMSCYEKRGVWLCHIPVWGTAMKNIVVRDNSMGTATGCR